MRLARSGAIGSAVIGRALSGSSFLSWIMIWFELPDYQICHVNDPSVSFPSWCAPTNTASQFPGTSWNNTKIYVLSNSSADKIWPSKLPQKFLDDHFAKETGSAGDENGSVCVHFTHSVFVNVVHRVIIIRCHCELWAKWSPVIRLNVEEWKMKNKKSEFKRTLNEYFF